jgi:hypothetical protein
MARPIRDDATLLRGVLHDPEYIQADHNTGGWIPTKRAMTFEHGGKESVFCHHMLQERGDSLDDVAIHGGALGLHRVVFRLEAGIARSLDFEAVHSPNRDTPIGYAHGDVEKPPNLSRSIFRVVRQELLNSMEPIDSAQITLERPQ